MTKRAKKRPFRMGTQRHPPGPTQREPTLERDDLPAVESAKIEIAALQNGWLVTDPDFVKYREFLLIKVMQLAIEEKQSPKITIAALRAVASTELKQQQLQLMAEAIELRRGEQLQPIAHESGGQQKPTFKIVQELIARKDVRDALDRRPNKPDQPSN